MGVMFIRHGYLKVYTSDFYKLGISLKRRYMSIRWCKENANIRICSMIFLLAKMRDPRDFGFNYVGCMWDGVDST